MGLTFAAAVAVATFAAIFRSEFDAWMPWIAERLRRWAVRLSQQALRERLNEEWAAYLNEVPGNLGKVVCAFGFCVAAGHLSSRMVLRHSMSSAFFRLGAYAVNRSAITQGAIEAVGDQNRVRTVGKNIQRMETAAMLNLAAVTYCRLGLLIYEPLNEEQRGLVRKIDLQLREMHVKALEQRGQVQAAKVQLRSLRKTHRVAIREPQKL